MRAKDAYVHNETAAMLKATENLLDFYYGFISARSHASDGNDIEEAKQRFLGAARTYAAVVPKSMQVNLKEMRQRVSKLDKAFL